MIKVLGDIMLDVWINGTATRLSPEAPVPVLKKQETTYNLGGAANLAVNLANLNLKFELFGAIANDNEGYKVLDLFKSHQNIDFIPAFDLSITTSKTRLTNHFNHIVRLDSEDFYLGNLVKENLYKSKSKTDFLVISDYNKGVVTSEILNWAFQNKIKTFIDPKGPAELYTNQWLVKPNQLEFEEWAGEFSPDKATEFAQLYNWEWLVVTRGAKGIFVTDKNGNHWTYNEPVRKLADVSGAGDCVLAGMVWAYVNGYTIPEAAKMACFAAARNVEKPGVVPITKQDLFKKTVFTNGCFDILHAGHLHLLKNAKELGDKLIVGLNSDQSIRKLKGKDRPVNTIEKRIKQLELLPWVDEVIVFDEDTPLELISKIKPSIIVKGGDYNYDSVVGNQLAEIVIIPTLEGFSTTSIIKELLK